MNQSTDELAWRLLCVSAMMLESGVDASELPKMGEKRKSLRKAWNTAIQEFSRKDLHATVSKFPAEVAWDTAHVVDRRIQQGKKNAP